MDPVTGGLVSGGLKLLGGLLGGKSKTPADNLLSQAKGARDAAAKYGFNPLTMLKYGQTGGSMGGGGAPLASADLLTGALLDVSDAVTGETERRAAANKLELELGRLKLDQLRGTLAVQPSATASVGSGLPALGKRSAVLLGPGDYLPQTVNPMRPFETPATPIQLRPVFTSPLSDPVRHTVGKEGGVAIPDPRLDRGSDVFIGGSLLMSTPGWSPTQVVEDQYGEFASWLYSLPKFASDVGTTFGYWAATSDSSPFQKPKYRKLNP